MSDYVVKYQSDDGQEIVLTPEIVRRYLVSGDARAVTADEVMMFIQMCKYQRLNPFAGEGYFVKYNGSPATPILSVNTFRKRAAASPVCAGWQPGVIVRKGDELIYREGSLVLDDEELVGGWCKVWRKDWSQPYTATVTLKEYMRYGKDGKPQRTWNKPATMIAKVAEARALGTVIPGLQGLYGAEEMNIDEDQLETQFESRSEVLEETMPVTERKPANPITDKQAKRLFAIAQGNTDLLKQVLSKYGYAHTKDIDKADYEAICDEVEAIVKGVEPIIENTDEIIQEVEDAIQEQTDSDNEVNLDDIPF